MKIYERFGGIALLAGVGCYAFCFLLIVLAPALLTDADEPFVTEFETGDRVAVPAYTDQEARGRDVYIKQICWHCHSQFIRPVNDENLRWGPVTQAGESMVDRPHLFGTRRIGPDLAREGGLRNDDWQMAHLYDARYTVPASVMPQFTWLFKPYQHADTIRNLVREGDTDGDGLVSAKFDKSALWSDEYKAALKSPGIDRGGVDAPIVVQGESEADLKAYIDRYTVQMMGDNILSDYDAREDPTQRATDLVAYLQRLGRAIGPWRRQIMMGTPVRPYTPPMRGLEDVYVKDVPTEDGEGMEPWITGINDGVMPRRERNARLHGIARDMASDEELLAAEEYAQEYEALMTAWRKVNPEWDRRLTQGKALYQRHCVGCHGELGRGNGPAAAWLLIRPRDFTLAKYRFRSTQVGNKPLDGDLYRTLYRGLPGSSMPAWRELPDEHLWLLVDYIKSFYETIDGDSQPFNLESKRLAIPSVPPMPYDDRDELFQRGRAVYVAMKCNNCHGTEGRGDGPGWSAEKDNGGRVRPRDFKPRDQWDQPELRMRAGATPRDLYRTVFTGLDGTGMPSSYLDFERAWGLTDAVERLQAEGGSPEDIATAQKAARVKLFSVLGEDLPGVIREEDDGKVTEYVDAFKRTKIGVFTTFGDDWALIWYVYRLMYGDDAEWPETTYED